MKTQIFALLILFVGVSTVSAQQQSASFRAGCGENPGFPEVAAVDLYNFHEPVNAVVWATGKETMAVGMFNFDGVERGNVAISGGIGCNAEDWSYQRVDVDEEFAGDAGLILKPRFPSEEITSIERENVIFGFTPSPEDTLFQVSYSRTADGKLFQSVFTLGNCWIDGQTYKCKIISSLEGVTYVPVSGILFNKHRKLVGRTRGGGSDGAGGFELVAKIDDSLFFTALRMAVPNEDAPEVPAEFSVGTAHPNPTDGLAKINIEVNTPQHVSAVVVDLLGRKVATIHDGFATSGTTRLRFDGANLPNGTYLLRIAGEHGLVVSRSITLIH